MMLYPVESPEQIRKYSISGNFCFNSSAPFEPNTMQAVAQASANIAVGAITVALNTSFCTGHPSRGSMVWAYFFPSLM